MNQYNFCPLQTPIGAPNNIGPLTPAPVPNFQNNSSNIAEQVFNSSSKHLLPSFDDKMQTNY